MIRPAYQQLIVLTTTRHGSWGRRVRALTPFSAAFISTAVRPNSSSERRRWLIQQPLRTRSRSSSSSSNHSSTTNLVPVTPLSVSAFPPAHRSSHYHWFSTTSSTCAAASSKTTATTAGATPFLLADIGEGIKEVELLQWYVKPGQTIQQFDNICQVQSDKATVDITSRYDGVVVDLAGTQVGDMIAVGSPLLHIQQQQPTGDLQTNDDHDVGDDTDTTTTTTPLAAIVEHVSTDHASSSSASTDIEYDASSSSSSDFDDGHGKVWMSPAVRRLCKEHEIDPRILQGSGPLGRLLKADVIAHLEQQQQQQPTTKTSAVPGRSEELAAAAENGEIIELRGYTRLMARTMTESLQIPHMGLGDQLDVTQLLKLRKQLNNSSDNKIQYSLLAFILKACSLALTDYPVVNAAMHNVATCQVRLQPYHHLGVAMDTPRGLVVPVVAHCEQRSIHEIQLELNRLKLAAATGNIPPNDLVTPTFTMSNIGALGAGLSLKPVLVPPQLAMGAMGRLQRVPRFVNENMNDDSDDLTVSAVHVLPVSWAGDHRFLDGATLARFHVRVNALVKDPMQMLVQLK